MNIFKKKTPYELYMQKGAGRNNVLRFIILGLLLLGLPLAVYLVQTQQIFRSEASGAAEQGLYITRAGNKTLAQMRTELRNAGWAQDITTGANGERIFHLYQRNVVGENYSCAVNKGDLNNMPAAIQIPAPGDEVAITIVEKLPEGSGGDWCLDWYPKVKITNQTTGAVYENKCRNGGDQSFKGAGPFGVTPPEAQVSNCFFVAPEAGNYKVEVRYDPGSSKSTCTPKFSSCEFSTQGVTTKPADPANPGAGGGTGQSPTALPAVSNLQVACNADNTAVRVTWDAVSNAGSYQLRVNEIKGAAPDWFPGESGSGDTTPVVEGTTTAAIPVNANSNYHISVQPLAANGQFSNGPTGSGIEFKCPAAGAATPGVAPTHFKIAFSQLDDAGWNAITPEDYIDANRLNKDITLPDGVGIKTMFVQFIYANGRKEVHPQPIRYSPVADPTISGISCEVDPSSASKTKITIRGTNLIKGSASQVKYAGQGTTIVSSGLDGSLIEATAAVSPQGPVNVEVIRADGKSVLGRCGTSLTFSANLVCRGVDQPIKNAEIEVFENKGGNARSIFKTTGVNFDNQGRALNLDPKLEKNTPYKIAIKAPLSLRKVIDFTTGNEETKHIETQEKLPLGDINGDGSINTSDFQLFRPQFGASKSAAGALADFNIDNRVNSVDYSCLVSNFNKTTDNISATR